MRFSLPATALILAMVLPAAALGGGTEIRSVEDAQICFNRPDAVATKIACVNVGTARGKLGEGLNAGRDMWIVEVRDADKRVIDKVRKGGEIVMISPMAYARRDPGKATFTIARVDKSAKPLKTDFIHIQSQVEPSFVSWNALAGTTFGMTALPPLSKSGTPQFRSDVRGEFLAGGTITGIAADGTLGATYTDAAAVQAYGDFSIITFKGGREFQVTDEALRPVSPRIDNLVAFTPAQQEKNGEGRDTKSDIPYPRVMYAVEGRKLGNSGTLYNLLPRLRATPRHGNDLLGMIPLQVSRANFLPRPQVMPDDRVLRHVIAWAAVWATDAGPVVSLLSYAGEPVSEERFRSINWWGGAYFDSGVLEALDGSARLATAQQGGWLNFVYDIGTKVYPSATAARNFVTSENGGRSEAYRREVAARIAAREREEQLRLQHAADAARRAEEAARRELAEAEAEIVEARQIAATGTDHYKVCSAAERMKYVASAAVLQDKCSQLYRAAQPQRKRDFWGDLASALDAWASAASGARYSAGASSAPAGASPEWEFARRQKAIDNSIRIATDPNWNGAASRSMR